MPEFIDCMRRVVGAKLDLSCRQVLLLCLCDPAVTPQQTDRQVKDMALEIGVAKPVISRAAEKLVDLGLLDRSQIGGDRRSCVLTSTTKGKGLIRSIIGQPASAATKRRA